MAYPNPNSGYSHPADLRPWVKPAPGKRRSGDGSTVRRIVNVAYLRTNVVFSSFSSAVRSGFSICRIFIFRNEAQSIYYIQRVTVIIARRLQMSTYVEKSRKECYRLGNVVCRQNCGLNRIGKIIIRTPPLKIKRLSSRCKSIRYIAHVVVRRSSAVRVQT